MEVNEAKKVLLAAPLNPTERIALNVLLAELDIEDLPGEQWRDIKDFEGYYQVSNRGIVKSFHKGKVTILKQQVTKGYLRVELQCPGKKRKVDVHILVAEVFLLNPENKPEVNHEDGVKSNNCVENLKWSAPSENRRHAVKMGLQRSGCDRPGATLTLEQVRELRRNYKAHDKKFGKKAFAKKFGVSESTIYKVLNGIRYKNVR